MNSLIIFKPSIMANRDVTVLEGEDSNHHILLFEKAKRTKKKKRIPRRFNDSRGVFENGEFGSVGESDSNQIQNGFCYIPSHIRKTRKSSVSDMAFCFHR